MQLIKNIKQNNVTKNVKFDVNFEKKKLSQGITPEDKVLGLGEPYIQRHPKA